MITAAISTILGILGGAAPDILKIATNRSEAKLEMERLRLETELAIKLKQAETDLKVTEIGADMDRAEMESYARQMEALYKLQSRQTGVKWVDAFNSLIRPATAALAMIVAFALIIAQGYATFSLVNAGEIDLSLAVSTLWGGFVGEIIQAVLGWMFGYRATRKVAIR